MERQLVINGFYRHFKDKLYQVKGTAIHSETKEKMVIYQGLYGEYELYVRPYDMFLSEVDHIKYPDVRQKYRFELIDIKTGQSLEKDESGKTHSGYECNAISDKDVMGKEIIDEKKTDKVAADKVISGRITAYKETEDRTAEGNDNNIWNEGNKIYETTQELTNETTNETISGTDAEQEESKLIRFLDAYDYKEKLDILTSMRSELNDNLIDIMAESIEVAVPEGDITDRYNSLRKCLLAHTKYEGLRLRQ